MQITVNKGPFVVFGVEFVPFCSHLFFNSNCDKAHLSPSDLNDDEFERLSREVHQATDDKTRSDLLDAFFLDRLSRIHLDEMNLERMNEVFDEIVPTDGSDACPPMSKEEFSPSDLASVAHIGQKQFTRVFKDYVGMTPKSYLRLLRFHKALMELQNADSELSLTETAWNCGYYDLSHMTADFKAICGYSPSELIDDKDNLTESLKPEFSNLMKKKIKIQNLI